jgi:Polyketide cyclase / dehydrase and lipid transport
MPRHENRATLVYSADDLFGVVAGVKDYPLFVPWCNGARIHRENRWEIIAERVIGFSPFQESLTSQVTLDRRKPPAINFNFLSSPPDASPSPAGSRLSMRSCQGIPDLAAGDLCSPSGVIPRQCRPFVGTRLCAA